MAALWGRYLHMLKKYPLATMSGTTCVIMSAGDCVSQLAVERRPLPKYDFKRTGRFAVVGLFVFGPVMRGWYWTLDKVYSGTKLAALKMTATDQALMAPTFVGLFISIMGALRGETFDSIKGKLQRDYTIVLVNNYKIWPLAQLINFYFLPLHHRVLFVNFVALGWNTYLAWATEKQWGHRLSSSLPLYPSYCVGVVRDKSHWERKLSYLVYNGYFWFIPLYNDGFVQAYVLF